MNDTVLGWAVGIVAGLVFGVPLIASLTGDNAPAPEPVAVEAPAPVVEAEPATEIADMTPPTLGERAAAALRGVDGREIENGSDDDWLSYGRTYKEQRYSPLTDINETNAGELGFAWGYETGTVRGMETTPIVADGIMFATGSWSHVYALDAKTGEEIWTYDPEVPGQWGRAACCDVVNRGVAVWDGRVYVGTLDGRLVALDAETGAPIWDINTIDRRWPYTITGAPRIIKGMVIIGNGGAEMGVRGYITAYDAKTGKQLWRFYTVPGNPDAPVESKAMEAAMETWSTGGTDLKWWEVGGGGTVWDAMAYDPDLDLLYIGVGNGSPWVRWVRSPGGGDNLYLSSIVAIKPDTGEMAWHYQTTPGDTWDYTATQHLMLADLEIDGRLRRVIMQAPKNGFFYVLDRGTGELLSADKYVKVTWATHVDMETGRPVEDPAASYREEAKEIYPPTVGGHNWQPMAFNREARLVYIPTLETPTLYVPGEVEDYEHRAGGWNLGMDFADISEIAEGAALPPVSGTLKAWDPVQQKEVWSVEHPTGWNGGIVSTAGNLVMQGTGDGRFVVYKADTGDKLYETDVKGGVIAPPMTYRVDGEQYIALAIGFGGAFPLAVLGQPENAVNKYGNDGRIIAFKIGGEKDVPGSAIERDPLPQPPALEADAATVIAGRDGYHRNCAVCHGFLGFSGLTIPDLRYSDSSVHGRFKEIVLGGELSVNGMPSFADLIDEADATSIQAYIVKIANDAYAAEQAP
jgi:PQQ-dependent dehydrogenase (methanol/ethanol family)